MLENHLHIRWDFMPGKQSQNSIRFLDVQYTQDLFDDAESTQHTSQHWMVGWPVKNELEGMWKQKVAAQSAALFRPIFAPATPAVQVKGVTHYVNFLCCCSELEGSSPTLQHPAAEPYYLQYLNNFTLGKSYCLKVTRHHMSEWRRYSIIMAKLPETY